MAKNYDNYGYEEESNNRSSLLRKILIIVMIIVSIFLILYLIKGCSNTKDKKNNNNENSNTTEKIDYEYELLQGGKTYFEMNNNENPTAPGECSIVELQTLINEKLVDADKLGSCNVNTTYVKLCMLENGSKHYTPWLTCVGYNSDELYKPLEQGSSKDIIGDKTYLEFKFTPQEVSKGTDILGPVETMWKDEIKYDKYKTLSSTKYYRYRDKLFKWTVSTKRYYSTEGIVSTPGETDQYFIVSPSSAYNQKSNKTTEAYKWYTATGTKEYYMKNGAKYPSLEPVGEYTLRDPQGIDVTRYRTRTITSTYSPTLYYVCATSASGTKWIYQTKPCGQGSNPQYNYEKEKIYSCATPSNGLLVRENQVPKGSTCYNYSAWSAVTATPCDTSKPNICQSVTKTYYYWYKLVNEVRSYYPSGGNKASKEKVYYINPPVKNAIRDTSTKATAYKWYSEKKTTTSTYTVLPPSGYSGATASSDYKWSEWSEWTTKNPTIKDGRSRSIETKMKIKLQEIQGKTAEGWNSLSQTPLTENELINLYKQKGYKVSTLEDIVNNGEIRYQLVIFVRNKKESI